MAQGTDGHCELAPGPTPPPAPEQLPASEQPPTRQQPPAPTIDALQAYVDANEQFRHAVGAADDERLVLTPYARGEYNDNYLFTVGRQGGPGRAPAKLLLRVNMGSQMHLLDQIGYEMGALRLLEPSGRTPRALYVDGSRAEVPWGVGVEEWLPGEALDYRRDLALAAQILADVHAVPVTPEAQDLLVTPAHPLGAIVDECREMFGAYRAWANADEAVLRTVDRMFTRADQIVEAELGRERARGGIRLGGRHIVNTEVNSANFLIDHCDGAHGTHGGDEEGATHSGGSATQSGGDAWAGCGACVEGATRTEGATRAGYLVDWEKPVLGEVEQDIGHFLAPTTTFWKTDVILTPAERASFVERYLAAVAGRFDVDGLAGRLGDYLVVTCLRGITWCAMAYTEYAGGGRAIANPDTYEKIRAYLSGTFLDRVTDEYY